MILNTQTLAEDEVHVWQADVSLLSADDARGALWQLLDEEETARLQRFKFERHRDEYLLAHGMLRCVLASYLKLDPRTIYINKTDRGKPFVPNSAFFFSLSHAEGCVVIALTNLGDIGVDVEPVNRTVNAGLVRTVLSDREQDALRHLPEEAQSRMFIRYWTLKEALLKASGDGITAQPRRICLGIGSDSWDDLQLLDRGALPHSDWTLWQRDWPKGYMSAVAVEGQHQQQQMHVLNFYEQWEANT